MIKEKYWIDKIGIEGKKKIESRESYMFLLFLSGSCQFFQGQNLYRCGLEDMILMKPRNSLILEKIRKEYPLEVIMIRYTGGLLEELSTEGTDLQRSLEVVPYTCISVHGDSEIIMILKNLLNSLYQAGKEPEAFAADLFETGILSMIIVLILRACIHAEFEQRPSGRRQFMLDQLFAYIHNHLTEDLTLDQLEKVFYVSKSHICREFKRKTGQTLHSYIVKRKLERCKGYIAQGMSVKEAYQQGGFGGYNHFFRAFKKEYGMTPKEYYNSQKTELPL